MSQLETLAQHRDAILLAEVAAWLHDDFKHTDQQIHKYVQGAPAPSGRQDTGDLIPSYTLSFLGKQLDFATVKKRKGEDFIAGYLNRCHYTAHIEKEDGNNRQSYPAYLSSPFGLEVSKIPDGLTDALRNNISWNVIAKTPFTGNERKHLQKELISLFNKVGGDTRRPANEITLWEWGHTVGALYKAALVGSFLRQVETPANDLRWRLLSIRIDGLVYLTSVSRLPDLIARQRTLQTALDNVQTLLEETYPLATEVYRDENGSLYVVPDIPSLLTDWRDKADQTLFAHVLLQFDTDGEIVPEITLDAEAWWGQDPNRNNQDEIPPAGRILARKAKIQSDPQIIAATWKKQHNEICPICGLRPCVSQQLDHCRVCGQRRQGRVQRWVQAQGTTIWLDEVADSNGRLALLTSTFDLTNWLNGELVETLLVQAPNSGPVTKTPSFARLRRIWRTTQTFWQETQANITKNLSDSRRRLKINLANSPGLTTHQTYELDLRGQTRMSVLWDGSHLISIDNLSYTAVQLNIPTPKRQSPADAALEVGLWLDKSKENEQGQKRVFRLISDDEKNRQFDIQIADVDYQDAAYSTAIPILAEPRTFMALVPADKALDILQTIKEKYEREMGKVRNRLPLHLGAVYFHRRTPLRAALDAGRRMLQQRPLGGDHTWMVQNDVLCGTLPADRQTLADGTQQFQQTITVQLKQDDRSLTWYVPAVMGDGSTPDNWYPYVFIKTENEQPPTGRSRVFKGCRPTATGSEACSLLHASELKAGDQIYFTPATFDFEWLDTSARRFEIAYDAQGKRYGRLTRPYLLDELDDIQQAWSLIAGPDGLTTSQIHALRNTIEPRREAWQASPQEETFRQLCSDAIRNAKRPSLSDIDRLTSWASSGLLADTIELYMEIMKVKPQRDERAGVTP